MTSRPTSDVTRKWGFRAVLIALALTATMGIAMFSASPVSGVTRTWTGLGATNLWSDQFNWSGNAVPGAADVATFDGTSAKNATIASNITVGGISIGAYGGTITQSGAVTVTVGATGFNQAGGTFTGGTAAMTVNGPLTLSAGSFTATTGTLSIAGALTHTAGGTFAAGSGTVALITSNVTIDVATTETFNNLTFTSGTKTVAAGDTLVANGTLNLNGGSVNTGTVAAHGAVNLALAFGGGTGTVLINGAAAQTLTGASTLVAGSLPNLVIDKPSGTLTLAGTIRTVRNWSYTAGTLDAGASTVVFAGTLSITGSHTLNAVVLNGAGVTYTVAAGTTVNVPGALTLTDGNIATGTVAAQGPLSQASTFDTGTGTLLINGTPDQTFTGASTLAAGSLANVVIDKPSGTLTLAGTIRTGRNWTYTAGTLDPGASTVVFAGNLTISGNHSLANVTFNGGGATYTVAAGTTLGVTGTLDLTDGNLNTGTLAAQGPINQASTFDGNTGTLLINGAGNQTFTGASTTAVGNLPNMVIDKPSGTLTLAGTIRTGHNWTYTAGTVDPGTSTLVYAGNLAVSGSHTLHDLTIATGTIAVAAATTVTAQGALTLTDGNIATGTVAAQGAISQAVTFDLGTGTLLINGTADQTFTGASTVAAGNLAGVVIDKPSGTLTLAGTIRTGRSWTYTAGTLDAGTSTVVFAGNLPVTGSHTLANLVIATGTITVAAGTTVNVPGTLTLTDGTINTGTVAAQGLISQASTFDTGSGTLLVNGSVDQTFTGASTLVLGSLPHLVIDKPSGTLSLAGTIRTGRNWTYTAGTVDPGTSTVVFAATLAITGSHTLHDVVFNGAAALYTVGAGTTLTVAGTLNLTDGNLNTGTVAAHGPINQASTFDGNTGVLLINGTVDQTFTGASTTAAGNLPNLVIDKPSGTLTLAGTIRTGHNWTYTAGVLDPGTSTVVFASTLAITGSHSLANVTFNGAGVTYTVTAGTTLTVAGTLGLTDGNLNTGTVAAHGPINQASTFDGNTGVLLINGTVDQTFTGASTTAAGNLPNLVIDKPSGTLTLAGTIRTGHNWTYTAGVLDPGTSTVVFVGGTVTSAGMAFRDLINNGGTTTLGSAMTVGRDLTITSGTFTTSASNHALTVGRNLSIAGTLRLNGSSVSVAGDVGLSGTLVAGTSTITMDGSGGQTLGGPSALTAFDLVVDDPAGVTLGANLTVGNVLTLSAGTLAVGPRTLTISRPLAGTIENLVAGATSSIVVNGAVAGIVLPNSVSQLNALTVNNTNGVALDGDLTVLTTLTLTSGPVTTGPWTVAIPAGGTVARTGGRVNGDLQKYVAAGTGTSVTFEVGDATQYAPATVVFGTVAVAGDLTTSTTAGDHPGVALSGIAPSLSVNRFWTITNGGVGFDAYDATFTFVAGDVDAGAIPANFVVAKLDGTTWTLPTVGARTALSTQALAMTSFSDFQLGEPTADLGVTVSDGLATVVAGDGLDHVSTVGVANAGPSTATSVVLTMTWPAGLPQGTVTPSQGTCAPVGAGPDFTCDLGSIASGATATVAIDYAVPASADPGPQVVTAAVASAVTDLDSSDDADSDTTTIVAVADLTLTIVDPTTTILAGSGSSHLATFQVDSDGPSDARSVVLTITWPSGLTRGVVTPSQGTCTPVGTGADLDCDLGTLTPGATATVTIAYTVSPLSAGGNQTMSASVSSAASDPTPDDDVTSHTILVIPNGLTPPETSSRRLLPGRPSGSQPAFEASWLILLLVALTVAVATLDRRSRPR